MHGETVKLACVQFESTVPLIDLQMLE